MYLQVSPFFGRAEDLVLVGLLLRHPGEELCVALAVLEAAGSGSDLGEVEATNMECILSTHKISKWIAGMDSKSKWMLGMEKKWI